MIKANRKKVWMTSTSANTRSKRASVTARVRISRWNKTISKMTMKNSRMEKLLMINNRTAQEWARNRHPQNRWFSVMANKWLRTQKRSKMAWCAKPTTIWKRMSFRTMKDKWWILRLCCSEMTNLSIGPRRFKIWVKFNLFQMNRASNYRRVSSQ